MGTKAIYNKKSIGKKTSKRSALAEEYLQCYAEDENHSK